MSDQRSPEKSLLPTQWAVAQNPFRSPKIIFDHSNVRSTANPKLALRAQTIGFAAVSLHEEWLPKILSCLLQGYGQQPVNIFFRPFALRAPFPNSQMSELCPFTTGFHKKSGNSGEILVDFSIQTDKMREFGRVWKDRT
jgi:hypothetical protein